MLPKDIKEKWVAALRSGEYKQGHKRLCTINQEGERTYCCLGVLCMVLEVPEHSDGSAVLFDNESSYLPRAISDRYEMSIDPVINFGDKGLNWRLSELNDGSTAHQREPMNFNQIADLIEKEDTI